jgi:hypothetical protein
MLTILHMDAEVMDDRTQPGEMSRWEENRVEWISVGSARVPLSNTRCRRVWPTPGLARIGPARHSGVMKCGGGGLAKTGENSPAYADTKKQLDCICEEPIGVRQRLYSM